MSEPAPEEYKKIIAAVKKEFPWMLADIKHRRDQINVDCYSDQLQGAIAVGELLDLID